MFYGFQIEANITLIFAHKQGAFFLDKPAKKTIIIKYLVMISGEGSTDTRYLKEAT